MQKVVSAVVQARILYMLVSQPLTLLWSMGCAATRLLACSEPCFSDPDVTAGLFGTPDGTVSPMAGPAPAHEYSVSCVAIPRRCAEPRGGEVVCCFLLLFELSILRVVLSRKLVFLLAERMRRMCTVKRPGR